MNVSHSPETSPPIRVLRRPHGEPITVQLDGQDIAAYAGETLLAALMSARGWALRRTECADLPRSMFCGMGACMDCLVQVEGEGNVRACMLHVRPGLRCRTLLPAVDTDPAAGE